MTRQARRALLGYVMSSTALVLCRLAAFDASGERRRSR